MHLSTSKIEDRAIRVLANVIDTYPHLHPRLNTGDKEMSVDGYIEMYSQNGLQNKENFDDKIWVQVKGHIITDKYDIGKNHIVYPVQINDLKVYLKDRGIIYFQIFMSEDNTEQHIFYCSLLPLKIKTLLETAKNNKSFINITFVKLEHPKDELNKILKQFSHESKKQGCGEGQLIRNACSLSDLKSSDTISATSYISDNTNDVLVKLSTGEISLYRSTKNSKIQIPILTNEKMRFINQNPQQESVTIKGTIYYTSYYVEAQNGCQYIVFSKNLFFDITNGKFLLKGISEYKQFKKDLEFLLQVYKHKEFMIGDHEFAFKYLKRNKNLEKFNDCLNKSQDPEKLYNTERLSKKDINKSL